MHGNTKLKNKEALMCAAAEAWNQA